MIVIAPEPPRSIPDIALTPFLFESAARRGDRPAIVDGLTGRTLTYRAWADAVRSAAAGLARRGFRKGDVFGILSPNVPEYAVAFHAVSLLGGINTTINPLYTPAETTQQLKDCRARFLVTIPPCAGRVAESARAAGVEELFVFGEAENATPFASLLVDDAPPAVEIDPAEDLVALPYSSGTTGMPKGVMLTHRNLVANLIQSAGTLDLAGNDVMLGVLPFFHIYGMTVIMNLGLYSGATIVTMPRFDLEQCLGIMEKYGVTFASVVPPIVLALAKSPLVDRFDLSRLRVIFSGAAPLSEALATAASARLGCRVLQGYGLTETSPVSHAARADADPPKYGSIGFPVPNTESKVVDIVTGETLGARQNGEICIRGPQVMKGYLNRPDATRAMIDADGWLHSGDIGYLDEDGCFFVVDRLKELIKFKGMQVAPAELEAILLGHPAIADAAVVPLPHDEAGEVPKAFVVLRGPATPEEIMAYVAERVAPFKKIRCVETIDQIPKSPAGKILRRVLIERQAARSPGAV